MNPTKKIILDIYGGTGAWSKPYEESGQYIVNNITLPDYNMLKTRYEGKSVIFAGGKEKALKIPLANIYGILAAPPCTEFSFLTSCNRPVKMETGLKTVDAALELIRRVMLLKEAKLQFWALENPAARLKWFLGNPPLEFDPCDFGDPWTKRTCIWGLFNIPKKHHVQPGESTTTLNQGLLDYKAKMRKKLGVIKTHEGWDADNALNSMTPPHFARAFFKANR